MDRMQIEEAILKELEKREKKVVNRNAIYALFAAFSDPISSLGKIFLGRKDALDLEKIKITQDIMLDLLCGIDNALSYAYNDAHQKGLNWTLISGTFDIHGNNTKEVIGVHISPSAGPVEFMPGTHIRATSNGANKLTGLKVGGDSKERKE